MCQKSSKTLQKAYYFFYTLPKMRNMDIDHSLDSSSWVKSICNKILITNSQFFKWNFEFSSPGRGQSLSFQYKFTFENFEGNFKRKYLERVKLSRGTVKTKNDQQKFLFLLKINFRGPFKSTVVLNFVKFYIKNAKIMMLAVPRF